MSRKVAFLGLGVVLLAGLLALSVSSCTQNANQVAVRSFELARQVDFVCMRVYGRLETDPIDVLRAIPARPTVPGDCPPVPTDVDGTFINWHLFALVTQFTRGEVAVVDLTAATVVDIDRQTPGINFIPVGAQPTDIAVSPDGKMTFVAAAEPNKPAIYGIANRGILGDSQQLPADGTRPIPKLTDLPVCVLPQKPGAVSIIPRNTNNNGGTDAGPPESQYEISVVLPGEAGKSAKLITLDPKPFLRGADPTTPPGDGGLLDERLEPTPGPRLEPGQLPECPITSAIELSGDLPSSWKPGPAWDDGIRNATGDAGGALPSTPGCVAPPPGGGGPVDGGAGAGDAGAQDAGSAGDAGTEFPTSSVTPEEPFGAFAARDGQTVYVADGALPMIHVMDLSVPGAPKELPPLLATSQVNPEREVSVGQIAVSPPTREFKKYLYAVDRKEGSVMVFDVTDPATAPRTPLTRPHAEINPFQVPDRLAFGAPVAALAFVRHDFSPRNPIDGTLMTAGVRGALCNPNQTASPDPNSSSFDPGTLFREEAQNQDPNLLLGPTRLRGIFAFVTLTNGRMVAVDVDDWDSPCRRPYDMSVPNSSVTPAQGGGGSGPYQAPLGPLGQTNELFFPMTAPNRARSQYRIRYTTTEIGTTDPVGSGHVPTLDSRPQLAVNGNTLQTLGAEGRVNPLLVPTFTGYPDQRFVNPDGGALNAPVDFPGVRFSYESPEVHFDQDWAVVYEGILPGMDGFQGTLKPKDDYAAMTLSQPAALFCRKGVEDARVSAQRSDVLTPAMSQAGLVTPAAPLDRHLGDYVQVTDDILDVSDDYWRQPNSCWDGNLAEPQPGVDIAVARHDACVSNFRNFSDTTTPSPFRDFPILEAYDDRLEIGAFSYPASDTGTPDMGRRVVERNASFNRVPLRTMECCFHKQVHFRVRTGGQWLALGSSVGYLHHIVKDANGACVQSCATRDQLLNARVPALPYPCTAQTSGVCTAAREDQVAVPLIDRNSPLVMRNPALSFGIYNGVSSGPIDIPPTRDARWGFSTRGGYVNYTLNLASSTTSVSPQSMRFVEAFQQLAVVDGASQGLMLFELNNVALAHSPYF